MGNATSSAISKEILEDLKLTTKFTEMEICQWYENFQKQCPTGRITPEEFEEIYTRFFPETDAKCYARHVFRSFDTNDDGTLDFKEYIIALHMTSSGKTTRKLEWAFSLFDVDKNGYINKSEVKEICQVRSALENRRNRGERVNEVGRLASLRDCVHEKTWLPVYFSLTLVIKQLSNCEFYVY